MLYNAPLFQQYVGVFRNLFLLPTPPPQKGFILWDAYFQPLYWSEIIAFIAATQLYFDNDNIILLELR